MSRLYLERKFWKYDSAHLTFTNWITLVTYISCHRLENRVFPHERKRMNYKIFKLYLCWKFNYKKIPFRTFAKTLYSNWSNFSLLLLFHFRIYYPFLETLDSLKANITRKLGSSTEDTYQTDSFKLLWLGDRDSRFQ
jgi:hypothetical protein